MVPSMSAPRVVTMASVPKLKLNKPNVRTHTKKQIRQLADLVLRYGWTYPILIEEEGNIIAGHARYQAETRERT
jgi:ParB-like chromosome segregation protein Spo0J